MRNYAKLHFVNRVPEKIVSYACEQCGYDTSCMTTFNTILRHEQIVRRCFKFLMMLKIHRLVRLPAVSLGRFWRCIHVEPFPRVWQRWKTVSF